MGIFATIVSFFSKFFQKRKKYPVYEDCSFCKERVYLPFHCDYCQQYYCGRHRLPFEHECKNISDWKRKSAPGGITVESKAGKRFVKK